MERLFSNKKISKAKEDVKGYFCNACTSTCVTTCTGACVSGCVSACGGCGFSCSNTCTYCAIN